MSPRLVFSLALAGLVCARAGAQNNSDPLTQQVRGVFERCQSAVVKIEAVDEHGKLSGSGFFVDPTGTLYTCYSVGGESRDIVVSQGDMKYTATRLAADPRSGLAILKVEARTPFLPIGKSKDLGAGSMVMTIGYPLDMPITPNFGCVGGWNLKYLQSYFAAAHLRANVPVQRGEGGAPLLNMNGEAVGILVSSLENGAGCFALPIEAAEKIRGDFMRFGELRPGWLGIKFSDGEKSAEGSAVRVEDFVRGAPAEKSGVRRGDILLQVGINKIATPDDVVNAAFYLTAGDEVPLTVSRDGERVELRIQPADHPDTPHPTAALPSAAGIPLKLSR